MKQIWTIGHSTRSWEEFVQLLNGFSIRQLVDIRSLPGSNRFPQFNQENMREKLPEVGIQYFYIKKLGGRRRMQKNSHNTIWKNKSFRAYTDYMETSSFDGGLATLKKLAREKNTVYMCSEAVWWRCHRSMISDELKAEGWEVIHIMGKGNGKEHPYTKPAKILNGKLIYGPAEDEIDFEDGA